MHWMKRYIFDDKQMQNGLIHYSGGIFDPKLDILFDNHLSVAVHDCGYHTQNMALCLSLLFYIAANVNNMQIFLLCVNYIVVIMMTGHIR